MTLDELYSYLFEVTEYMQETGFIGEIKTINDLDIDSIQGLCDKAIRDGNSVSEYNNTLTNMLFCDKKNVVSKRLALTLFNKLHLLSGDSKDPISSSLVEALNNMYFLELSFDCTMYNIFNGLLLEEAMTKKHSKKIKQELMEIYNNLKFIYFNNNLYKKSITLKDYEQEYYYRELLDKNIRRCIDILSSFSNSELQDEKIYAKAIAVKIYLRGLLIALNNLEELADYDKIVSEKQMNNTLTKKMINEVFIQNYFDLDTFHSKEGGMRNGI